MEVLIEWLNKGVGLSAEISNLSRQFANGYLLAELLWRFNQLPQFPEGFCVSTRRDEIISNFSKIEPVLRRLGLSFDAGRAMRLITYSPDEAATLLRSLKDILKAVTPATHATSKTPVLPPLKTGFSKMKSAMANSKIFVERLQRELEPANIVLLKKKLKRFKSRIENPKCSEETVATINFNKKTYHNIAQKELANKMLQPKEAGGSAVLTKQPSRVGLNIKKEKKESTLSACENKKVQDMQLTMPLNAIESTRNIAEFENSLITKQLISNGPTSLRLQKFNAEIKLREQKLLSSVIISEKERELRTALAALEDNRIESVLKRDTKSLLHLAAQESRQEEEIRYECHRACQYQGLIKDNRELFNKNIAAEEQIIEQRKFEVFVQQLGQMRVLYEGYIADLSEEEQNSIKRTALRKFEKDFIQLRPLTEALRDISIFTCEDAEKINYQALYNVEASEFFAQTGKSWKCLSIVEKDVTLFYLRKAKNLILSLESLSSGSFSVAANEEAHLELRAAFKSLISYPAKEDSAIDVRCVDEGEPTQSAILSPLPVEAMRVALLGPAFMNMYQLGKHMAETLNLDLITIENIVDSLVNEGTASDSLLSALIEAKPLATTELVRVVAEKIKNWQSKKGVIILGYPLCVQDAEKIEEILNCSRPQGLTYDVPLLLSLLDDKEKNWEGSVPLISCFDSVFVVNASASEQAQNLLTKRLQKAKVPEQGFKPLPLLTEAEEELFFHSSTSVVLTDGLGDIANFYTHRKSRTIAHPALRWLELSGDAEACVQIIVKAANDFEEVYQKTHQALALEAGEKQRRKREEDDRLRSPLHSQSNQEEIVAEIEFCLTLLEGYDREPQITLGEFYAHFAQEYEKTVAHLLIKRDEVDAEIAQLRAESLSSIISAVKAPAGIGTCWWAFQEARDLLAADRDFFMQPACIAELHLRLERTREEAEDLIKSKYITLSRMKEEYRTGPKICKVFESALALSQQFIEAELIRADVEATIAKLIAGCTNANNALFTQPQLAPIRPITTIADVHSAREEFEAQIRQLQGALAQLPNDTGEKIKKEKTPPQPLWVRACNLRAVERLTVLSTYLNELVQKLVHYGHELDEFNALVLRMAYKREMQVSQDLYWTLAWALEEDVLCHCECGDGFHYSILFPPPKIKASNEVIPLDGCKLSLRTLRVLIRFTNFKESYLTRDDLLGIYGLLQTLGEAHSRWAQLEAEDFLQLTQRLGTPESESVPKRLFVALLIIGDFCPITPEAQRFYQRKAQEGLKFTQDEFIETLLFFELEQQMLNFSNTEMVARKELLFTTLAKGNKSLSLQSLLDVCVFLTGEGKSYFELLFHH